MNEKDGRMSQARRPRRAAVLATLLLLVGAVMLAGCGGAKTPEPTATPTSVLGPTAAVPPSQLGITFVDNDCFLLVADGKKILVDAHERIVSREIWSAIQEARPPFDGVDLLLVSHNHADHFDPDLIGPQLLLSPNALLATTQEVADALEAGFPDYAQVQDRVRVFGPAEGERVSVTLNGIEMEVLYLSHDYSVFNLGFILRFGDKTLLHTGDTFPPHLLTYDFPQDNLDFAFVPYFYFGDGPYMEDGVPVVLDMLQAKHLIPMHHSARTANLDAVLDQIGERCPNCVLFRKAMETLVVE